MRRSKNLFKRAQGYLAGGVNSPVRAFKAVGGHPLFVTRGRGSRFWDADGKSYIDYVGSWGPLILGHAPEVVVKAAAKAMRSGSTFGAPTESEIKLAALVREAFPTMERMRFVSSGTEACMSALRLARGYTRRRLIIKFAGCYHGHSDGLLVSAGSGALTFGHPNSAGVPKEFARLTVVLPFNDVQAVRSAFSKWGRDIAAVIVEPVAGNMGLVRGHEIFLTALRDLTRAYGSVLIFDEVITGFRLGWGGAQQFYRIDPDMTCLGKIVGGGFPVGVFGGTKEIMEELAPLGPVYQAGTLSGNPVAMAAGAATLQTLKRRSPYEKMRQATETLVDGIRFLARKHDRPVTVNSIESLFTLFFCNRPVFDLASALRSDTGVYAKFFRGLLEEGVYFPPAQFEAAFLSSVHTAEDVETTLRAVDKVLRHL